MIYEQKDYQNKYDVRERGMVPKTCLDGRSCKILAMNADVCSECEQLLQVSSRNVRVSSNNTCPE